MRVSDACRVSIIIITRSTQAHVASRRERYKYEMLLAAVTTQYHKYQSPMQQALHIGQPPTDPA